MYSNKYTLMLETFCHHDHSPVVNH